MPSEPAIGTLLLFGYLSALGLIPLPSPIHEFATALLRRVALQRPTDFTGLGVVFYTRLEALPFIALEVSAGQRCPLPVSGLEEIALMLASASSAASSLHDGFHFVDVSKLHLTHLAQFLSPPLPQNGEQAPQASGARHMTAMLASRVEGIVGVGLLTGGRELAFFERGAKTLRLTFQ